MSPFCGIRKNQCMHSHAYISFQPTNASRGETALASKLVAFYLSLFKTVLSTADKPESRNKDSSKGKETERNKKSKKTARKGKGDLRSEKEKRDGRLKKSIGMVPEDNR